MSLLDKIKESAKKNGTVIQSSEAQKLETIINRAFFAPTNKDTELEFIRLLLKRNAGEQGKRKGLHASSLIATEAEFCLRCQVLSLFYHQLQSEHIPVGLKRVFEAGNAIHEKYQRLFLRAGFSKPDELDKTQFNQEYMIAFSPDIICRIPDFYNGVMVGEIKSMNTHLFQKGTKHPSAYKQLQWYLHLTGINKGFVLLEDKNSQAIRFEIYDYEPTISIVPINRANEIIERFNELKNTSGKRGMPKKCKECDSSQCKKAASCNMQLSCWGLPGGRIKLEA